MGRLAYAVTVGSVVMMLVAGCVTKATYHKALDQLNTCQSELASTRKGRDSLQAQEKKLEKELAMLRDSSSQSSAAKEARISKLLSDMKATKSELLELRKQREAAQKRLAAYRELNQKFRALVDTGKLEVTFRNGQMVLKLPSAVLFPSGRAKLSKPGRKALQDVLNVLLQFKNRRYMIAGHTDNVKIHSHRFKDNWQLSTARALSILKYMIKAGFDPKNLAAAGYGQYDPVASNDTPQGRAKNRRIEIILVPDLSELPNLTPPKS